MNRRSDVACLRGLLYQVVDERVDAASPGRAEQLDLVLRQLGGREDAEAHRVVDVVVDVRDAVDDPDDPSFKRRRLARARVGEDAVANLVGQVELLGDPQRLLVVVKAPSEPLP
jgi:hypothetical protein